MSNLPYDTPTILMSTTEDDKETPIQVQCCQYWKISNDSLSL